MSNPIALPIRLPNDGTPSNPSISFGGSSISSSGTGLYGNETSMHIGILGSSVIGFGSSGMLGTVLYTPAASGDWDGDPTTVADALDRIAAAVAGLLTTPIP